MDDTISLYDYTLPPDLIAQEPCSEREHSRLLVVDRSAARLIDDHFYNLGKYLRPGDLLVANRSRVIPALLEASKPTGGRVHMLLLNPLTDETWLVLARPSRKLRTGIDLSLGSDGLLARILEARGNGQWLVQFHGVSDVPRRLRDVGQVPLPPYLRASKAPEHRYQTVYADTDGSIAAPTAGLHFSSELIDALHRQGIGIRFVTLHVGVGTFKPVQSEHIDKHQMHSEWGEISPEVAASINETRESGGRVVAIGTTTTRLLESAVNDGFVVPFQGMTDIFIRPGHRFRAVDALVTNFHLPRSTLLMLVSAMIGRGQALQAYAHAVEHEYRFFSFGDAMLIL